MATVWEDRIKGRRNGNGNVWRAHNALGLSAKKEGEIGVGNWDAPPRIMERMRAREMMG